MTLVRPRDFVSFGWSVGCQDRTPAQVRDEMRDLVENVADVWRSYFPAHLGYRVQAESPAGPSHGVQLSVTRGDFRARVSVDTALSRRLSAERSAPVLTVRMCGRAESDALATIDQREAQLVATSRNAGAGLGLALFGGLSWVMMGQGTTTVYVLGGVLLSVLLLLSSMAGGTLGSWLGERLAWIIHQRVRDTCESDVVLQHDLRRWKALSRKLADRRDAIVGGVRGLPFRSERDTGPLRRVTTRTRSRSYRALRAAG